MKRTLIIAAAAASLVYYVSMPFFVAQAGGNPDTGGAAGTGSVQMSLYMRITAYTSVPDETDSTPFITANGTYVHDGVAASNILPFGTKIEIPELFGNKVFVVDDRMSPKIKNTVDIWMPTVAKAIYFGANHASVIVLSEPTSTPHSLALAVK